MVNLKIKSFTVSNKMGGVFSTGSYENERHESSLSVTFEGEDISEEVIKLETEKINNRIRSEMQSREQESIIKGLEKRFQNFRWYTHPQTSEKFISVTSVITGMNPNAFFQNDPKLKGYYARGSARHLILENYIKEGEWFEPEKIPEAIKYLKIMKAYKVEMDGNIKGWVEKYKPEFTDSEIAVYNSKDKYAGRLDALGKLDDLTTIFDLKGNASDPIPAFKQMSAYVKALPKRKQPEQMCIIVANGNTKQGFSKPVTTTAIDEYYKMFLQDRTEFKEMFGV